MRLRSSKRALEDTQRLAAMFPGIAAVFADLAQVESIEQMADAAELRLETAKQATSAKQVELADTTKKHEQAKADAVAQSATTKTQLEAILEQARGQAAKIVSDAQDKAGNLLDEAQDKADALADAENDKLQLLGQQTAQQRGVLAKLNADAAKAQDKLATVQAQLAAFEKQKADLKARLG